MDQTNQFDSKYRYIMVAAKRARQLQRGAPALVESGSGKACRVALDEIDAGKISYVLNEEEEDSPAN
jgi:DNA-directed RNA polymerase subunit omega